MRNIAVIGGGASGIAAAITAAERGARVTVFEAAKRIGHSILVSGNGRCNWSNAQVNAAAYNDLSFVGRAFAACPPQRVWDWFADLGLLSFEEGEGRLYPRPNKASSVLDVLRFRLDELGVRVECEREVASVRRHAGTWSVEFAEGRTQSFDAVVVACGGSLPEQVLPEGYRFQKKRRRLCPIRTDRDAVKGLDNIRVRGAARLLRAGKTVARERGEVQFRSFGVSGIAVFNLSRFAQRGDAIELDLLPDVDGDALAGDLHARCLRFSGRTAEQALAGAVLPAIARAVLRQAGIDPQGALHPDDAPRVASCLKRYRLQVQGFEEKTAQVTQGGVALSQVDAATMESKRDPGLFILGEALDVDGPCGGFNLHWAWTCGLLAGSAC